MTKTFVMVTYPMGFRLLFSLAEWQTHCDDLRPLGCRVDYLVRCRPKTA